MSQKKRSGKFIFADFFIFEDAAGVRYVQSDGPFPKGFFKAFTRGSKGKFRLVAERVKPETGRR